MNYLAYESESHEDGNTSKDFFAETKSELGALFREFSAQLRWSTVEDSNPALLLILQLLEHFVPVWSTRFRPRLQSSY